MRQRLRKDYKRPSVNLRYVSSGGTHRWTILVGALVFISIFVGYGKRPVEAISPQSRFEENVKGQPKPATPSSSTPPVGTRLSWLDELRALSKEFEGRVAMVRVRKKVTDQEHFDILRREIRQAIAVAPSGRPAVVLGAGGLRDIPNELFTSDKFPQIILIDINADLMRKAIRNRGLQDQLGSGRIQLVEIDLSMLSPQMLEEIQRIVGQSRNIEEVKRSLIALYRRAAATATQIQLPASLQPHQTGLVVSSTLIPTMTTFTQLVIDRMVARRFGQRLPIEPNESLFANRPEHRDYMEADSLLINRIYETHAQFLSELVSADGVVYLSIPISLLSLPALRSRWMVSTAELAEAFGEVVKTFSRQISAPRRRSVELVRGTFEDYARNPFGAAVRMSVPVYGILNNVGSYWIRGMQVMDTNVWVWEDRPDMGSGQLVQSMLMRPFKPFDSLRQKLAAGQRLDAVEIFHALREGLDRMLIEKGASEQGHALTSGELEQWRRMGTDVDLLDARYGFSLTDDELRQIFEALNLEPGQQVLEIGPGQTVLCVIAALMGAKVTVVEPSAKYGVRLNGVVAQVEDLIRLAGGELTSINRSVLDSDVQRQLPDGTYDQVWGLDVLIAPETAREYREMDRKTPVKISLEVGIIDEQQARQVAETIARLKKPTGGRVYVSIISQQYRTPAENIVSQALRSRGLTISGQTWVATPLETQAIMGSSDRGVVYQFAEPPSKPIPSEGRIKVTTETPYSLAPEVEQLLPRLKDMLPRPLHYLIDGRQADEWVRVARDSGKEALLDRLKQFTQQPHVARQLIGMPEGKAQELLQVFIAQGIIAQDPKAQSITDLPPTSAEERIAQDM